ncbi:MAG: NADH-quinone oxidoreductase subunit H [Bdellovibrionales bacterium]|nr:NADH-quinone oxidoreductase subunit H [Bdellovibrionales bacterium]
MGVDLFEITVNLVKMIFIFVMMVNAVPLLVWVERRGSAFIQNRYGPNRVGPLGLVQLLADAVKFIFKEEFVPGKGHRLVFYLAPVVALIPGALAFAAIPLSMPIELGEFSQIPLGLFTIDLGETYGPYRFAFQGYEIGIGIVFVLGVSSLAAYALLMAGWGSANKYSLYGALRASAQTISYELALGLSLVGILLLFNTFNFKEIVEIQSQALTFSFLGSQMTVPYLPNWGIIYQPVGAIIFFAAMFAETNRLPFDLPEAEAELVAGYHTEYGGIKMNMFYIGEYGHMLVASALMVTFYFGGYTLYPFFTPETVNQFWSETMGLTGNPVALLSSLSLHLVFMVKLVIFLWVFIHVRWTLPRFRYDQLMDLGWKTMLPWALANTILTAVVILIMRAAWS